MGMDLDRARRAPGHSTKPTRFFSTLDDSDRHQSHFGATDWNTASDRRMLPGAISTRLDHQRKRSREIKSMSSPSVAPRSRLKSNRPIVCAVLSGLALVPFCSSAQAQQPPTTGVVTTQVDFSLKGLEPGRGSGERPKLMKSQELLKQGKLDEAEAVIDEVLKFFENETADKQVDYVCVVNRQQFDRYQKEHPGERKIVWLDWCYGWALCKKGWIAGARTRLAEAETWLTKSVKMRPYSADAYIERGFVYSQLGRPDDGMKSYETALSLARTIPFEKAFEAAALRGMGFDFIELKKLPQARKVFRESLRIEPANRVALGELLYITRLEQQWAEQEFGELKRQGRWAEIVAKLDRHLASASDDLAARMLRAGARAEQAQWGAAIDELESVLKVDPENPTALYFIALAQLGAGNDQEYRRACGRMLARFPIEFDAAPSVVAACSVIPDAVADLTSVRATAQMIHNARVASNARLKKARPVAETQGELGRILYRSGQFDDAVRQLDEALTSQSGNDYPTFLNLAFLAMAHDRLGNSLEAARRLAEAEKLLERISHDPKREPAAWNVRVAVDRVRKEAESLSGPAKGAPEPGKR
jgi:tetratricopeptide (TPR) repeat protein